MTNNIFNSDFMWDYTDEDFKDTDKVNDFLNKTDVIIEEYDRLPKSLKYIVESILPTNWRDEIISMQNHAIDVNLSAEENKVAHKNSTTELAERYVNTEVTDFFNKYNIAFTNEQKEDLICVYDKFAQWILNQ